MNIRMYLKKGGGKVAKRLQMTLGIESGQEYVSVPSLTWVAPKEIAGLETHFTLRHHFHQDTRECGIYVEKSTRATLSTVREGRGEIYFMLEIEAETLSDLRVMFEKILNGDIRPSHSLSAPQAGPSREELEAEVVRQRALLTEANSQVLWLLQHNSALLSEVAARANRLRQSRFTFLLSKTDTVNDLDRIAQKFTVTSDDLLRHDGIGPNLGAEWLRAKDWIDTSEKSASEPNTSAAT